MYGHVVASFAKGSERQRKVEMSCYEVVCGIPMTVNMKAPSSKTQAMARTSIITQNPPSLLNKGLYQ